MINETLEANRAYQRDKDDAYNRGYKQGKADAEPHWIPVTERLPDVGQEVLAEMDDKVSISVGHVDPCGWWFVDFSAEERNDVIAWMPLPEPYKGVTT